LTDEVSEAKIVEKTVRVLKMARQVIEKFNQGGDGEHSFQEEPSLSELVIVAQLLGQTYTIDGLRAMGIPEVPVSEPPSPPSPAPPLGEAYSVAPPLPPPDISILWSDGWVVSLPNAVGVPPVRCLTVQQLLVTLQSYAQMVEAHYGGQDQSEGLPQVPPG